jgi:quercetin dioxygenase-like cupin family protein
MNRERREHRAMSGGFPVDEHRQNPYHWNSINEEIPIGANLMNRQTFSMTVFVAVVSVILFSGQRPVAPQSQQRQPAQPVQQDTPPKPTVRSAAPPPAASPPVAPPPATAPAGEMPSVYFLPEEINFPESRNITLLGDPRVAGLYVTRSLIPKGTKTTPHVHPDSRTVTVISGTCYYGRGESAVEFDETKTIPMPPGSFFTEPAGVPHFIWAKDSDVIVQTTAIGPSGTQLVPTSPRR